MQQQSIHMQNRREFIRSGLRYLTLGGLVSIGGALIVNRSDGKIHTDPNICRTCEQLTGCELPAAQIARNIPRQAKSVERRAP